MGPMKSGPDQLRDWMGRRRFNQSEAAKYLGLTEPNLSIFVNAIRRPGLDNAINIERLTGIPVEAWASKNIDESDERPSTDAQKRSA
jgi:transcriptional regulator with XRE-family HTH domain